MRKSARWLGGIFVSIILAATSVVSPTAGWTQDGSTEQSGQSQAPSFVDNDSALQEAETSGREVTVIIALADPPLATYEGGIQGHGRTKPAKGGKLNAKSADAQAYSRYLAGRYREFASWLRSVAPSARIRRQYHTVLNGVAVTLSGRDLTAVRGGPGVRSVAVTLEFRPLMNISRGLIGGPDIDSDIARLPGVPSAGAGMKIGIIDTGIAKDHPFFNPGGYQAPQGFPVADTAANLACCTSNKVIVARAYPAPGGAQSAVDTNGHGSHVAGTAAGNASATAQVGGVTISGLSGIAHRASLGNYNVFPNGQASASSPEIIAAIEDAVDDSMDAINLSLGGPVMVPEQDDPLAQAVNAAAEAGVIPAVAAGNSGPGRFTIQSPGSASSALTAAASTNPHFVGQPVSGVHASGTVGGTVGAFSPFTSTTTSWVFLGSNFACGTVALPAPTAPGQIAVITRGGCSFTTKIRNAQNAANGGYAGVIVQNNVAGDPIAMGHDGTSPFPTIPAVMIAVGPLAGSSGTVTISGTIAESVSATNLTPGGATANADIVAGFSSRGPVPIINTLKPDFAAPGVNVLSAWNVLSPAPVWRFLQGTSMATPHVVGAATLLKQLHPAWGVQEVKSALLTLAKRPVFNSSTGVGDTTPLDRGGGRINLAASKDAKAAFKPASLSFGQVEENTKTVQVTLTNLGASPNTWTITPAPVATACGGISLAVSASATPLVGPGGIATFSVTATVPDDEPVRFCFGDVIVSDGVQAHRLPFLVLHPVDGGLNEPGP